jgi:hypothetical protein
MPLKNAAKQQNVYSQTIARKSERCRVANPEGLDGVKFKISDFLILYRTTVKKNNELF